MVVAVSRVIAKITSGLVLGMVLSGDAAPPPVPLVAVAPAAPLRPAYHLKVATVPEPPSDVARVSTADTEEATAPLGPAGVSHCPLDVRAIIEGGEESFAIVSDDGNSRIVRPGDSMRTTRGWVSVLSISKSLVRVRHRGTVKRCALKL